MTKLPMPVICECGFSTMDAKKAYNHAMKHLQVEDRFDYYDEKNELPPEQCKPYERIL